MEPKQEIKCPHCGEWSDEEAWKESEVGCEDCGSHPSLICPKCEEHTDCVINSDKLEYRDKEQHDKEESKQEAQKPRR